MDKIQSPLITDRKRIPQEVIDNVVSEIANVFNPEKIILFGSYALGNPRPESDVDLLVVMEGEGGGRRQSLTIRQHLGVLFGLDLIVHSKEELEERIRKGDWFLREVTDQGKVVYERTDS